MTLGDRCFWSPFIPLRRISHHRCGSWRFNTVNGVPCSLQQDGRGRRVILGYFRQSRILIAGKCPCSKATIGNISSYGRTCYFRQCA